MVSRVAKLIISAAYLSCAMFARPFMRIFGRTPKGTCVILYYHSVPAEHRNAFAQQLDIMQKLATPLDIDTPAVLQPGRRYAGITFDDGFQDAIDNAIPELVKRKMPATFFITVAALGRSAEWWPQSSAERHRLIATSEQLRAVKSQWIRFASHTLTHRRLASLVEEDAKWEISESRTKLELLIGGRITSISFPYGDFNEHVARWCREAGYLRAFTTRHENAFDFPGAFLVGRVKVEPTEWKIEFCVKLLGGYVWLPWAINLKDRVRLWMRKGKELSTEVPDGREFGLRHRRDITCNGHDAGTRSDDR